MSMRVDLSKYDNFLNYKITNADVIAGFAEEYSPPHLGVSVPILHGLRQDLGARRHEDLQLMTAQQIRAEVRARSGRKHKEAVKANVLIK